jgi:hypothetical protein
MALAADPASISVAANGSGTVQVTGGIGAKHVSVEPDAAVATASFDAASGVLTITGVAEGTTTLTISDSATPTASTIDVAITVTAASTVADGSPAAPLNAVGMDSTVDPTGNMVTVAEGEANIAPQLNVADCTYADVVAYVWLPDYGFGVDLSNFVTVTCDAGVLTLDLGAIDFTDFAGTYDFYIGYVDGSGGVQYTAYELVVE